MSDFPSIWGVKHPDGHEIKIIEQDPSKCPKVCQEPECQLELVRGYVGCSSAASHHVAHCPVHNKQGYNASKWVQELNVLIAFERSGKIRDAFIKRGHNAYSCDLEPSEIPGPHIQGDAMVVMYDRRHAWDLMIAHPVCTFLGISGVQWLTHPEDAHLPAWMRRPNPHYPDRMKGVEDGVDMFLKTANAPIDKIGIENPVGIMSTRFRKPDQIIQPWQFGHPHAKKTCLWLIGHLPSLKPTEIVEPEYITLSSGKRMPKWYSDAKVSNDDERRRLRSETFDGVADAMADQWG